MNIIIIELSFSYAYDSGGGNFSESARDGEYYYIADTIIDVVARGGGGRLLRRSTPGIREFPGSRRTALGRFLRTVRAPESGECPPPPTAPRQSPRRFSSGPFEKQ